VVRRAVAQTHHARQTGVRRGDDVTLIRGILGILLAIAALAFPGAALLSIAILFGAYAFVDGVVAIWTATRISHGGRRWIWLLGNTRRGWGRRCCLGSI